MLFVLGFAGKDDVGGSCKFDMAVHMSAKFWTDVQATKPMEMYGRGYYMYSTTQVKAQTQGQGLWVLDAAHALLQPAGYVGPAPRLLYRGVVHTHAVFAVAHIGFRMHSIIAIQCLLLHMQHIDRTCLGRRMPQQLPDSLRL